VLLAAATAHGAALDANSASFCCTRTFNALAVGLLTGQAWSNKRANALDLLVKHQRQRLGQRGDGH